MKVRWPVNRSRELATLPAPAFARLMLAVFFSIGAVIICTDLMESLQKPLWWTLVRASILGAAAAVSLSIAGRGRRALLIVLPMVFLAVAATVVAARALPPNRLLFEPGLEQLRKRLALEGSLTVIALSLAYAIFLRTIGTEVSRHIRTRAELVLAEQVQQSLAPPLSLEAAGYEIQGRSVASSQMGGDLLDAVKEPGSAAVYLADVAGHGVQAGVFMGMVKSSARMALLKGGPVADLLGDLNRVVYDVKTAPATYVAFSCLRCGAGGQVEYAIAGSGPILHYQARSRTSRQLGMEQFPLGMFPKAEFVSGMLSLEPGDMLALMTDGIPETADANDQQFGLERIGGILEAGRGKPLTELTDTVFAAVRNHGAQTDDETLVLIRAI